jgi:hypothetical protein
MKYANWSWIGLFIFASSLAGCSGASTERRRDSERATAPDGDEAHVQTNLGKLSAEDRKLAQEQTFCAVEDENRLGSMGVPVRVTVNDQPVFLCCKGCRKKALADPDKTLAKVNKLKAKAVGPPRNEPVSVRPVE